MSVKLRDFELTQNEIKDLSFIIIVLSILFSITTKRFSNIDSSLFILFIKYIFFLFFLMLSRLFFMKFIALKQGFKLNLYQTNFSKYGLRKYESVGSFTKHYTKPQITHAPTQINKIPMSILSFIVYLLSFGLIIYPALWRYKFEKVPHLFLGTKQKFEYGMGFMYNTEISNYRKMKVLFTGYLFYFLFALILKVILPQGEMFFWYLGISFYIGLVSLLPVFGSEGYDLYVRNRFAYISSITILILSLLSVLIFDSILYVIISAIFTSLIILTIIFYKNFFWEK